jgi:hypothetical protein
MTPDRLESSLDTGEAQRSVRATVRRQGNRLGAATPAGTVAALASAACMPIVWPLLGGAPDAAKAGVAVLGGAGGGHISDVLERVTRRLRGHPGSRSREHVQRVLERELLSCLQGEDEHAAGVRAEAADLLDQVHAVREALTVAAPGVRSSLADAFDEMARSFGEFRWMLVETRRVAMAADEEQHRRG